jgi:hypothetical protein
VGSVFKLRDFPVSCSFPLPAVIGADWHGTVALADARQGSRWRHWRVNARPGDIAAPRCWRPSREARAQDGVVGFDRSWTKLPEDLGDLQMHSATVASLV